mmetsp:Transcript_18344/g.39056  ORF Transcript_18344/g.39056 Transcript_18344/m.39056 type:complete len:265 (+) Transcript_18344:552-1346(+)
MPGRLSTRTTVPETALARLRQRSGHHLNSSLNGCQPPCTLAKMRKSKAFDAQLGTVNETVSASAMAMAQQFQDSQMSSASLPFTLPWKRYCRESIPSHSKTPPSESSVLTFEMLCQDASMAIVSSAVAIMPMPLIRMTPAASKCLSSSNPVAMLTRKRGSSNTGSSSSSAEPEAVTIIMATTPCTTAAEASRASESLPEISLSLSLTGRDSATSLLWMRSTRPDSRRQPHCHVGFWVAFLRRSARKPSGAGISVVPKHFANNCV